jgi:hypothetical protein
MNSLILSSHETKLDKKSSTRPLSIRSKDRKETLEETEDESMEEEEEDDEDEDISVDDKNDSSDNLTSFSKTKVGISSR